MLRYIGITRAQSDQLLRNMVARGALEPLVDPAPEPSDEPTQARAHHEAGHAIAVVYAGTTIEIVTMCPPLCRTDQAEWPEPGSARATALASIDLCGPMAEARFYGREITSVADVYRYGGRLDEENFERRVAIICGGKVKLIEALRVAAIAMADRLVRDHWDCICEVASDLAYGGSLLHSSVIRAIERAPTGPQVLGKHTHPAAPALRSISAWGGTIKECGPFELVAIDAAGNRTRCANLRDAFLALTMG